MINQGENAQKTFKLSYTIGLPLTAGQSSEEELKFRKKKKDLADSAAVTSGGY